MVLADLKPGRESLEIRGLAPRQRDLARRALGRLPIQLLEDGVDRLAAQVQIGGQLAADDGEEPPYLRQLGALSS